MSTNIIQEYLEKALSLYGNDESVSTFVEAKNLYFEKAGVVNEDEDEYEPRMNSFNDWFLLQYLPPNRTEPLIIDYLNQQEESDEIKQAFLNVNHAIFEYVGTNFRKQLVFKDLLHDKKVTFDKDYALPSIVKDDIFTGRVVNFNEKNYILKGLCLLPKEVKSILKKESKKLRQLADPLEEVSFLLKVEKLKTKWLRYGHIDARKIFIF
jgi:hypothetical protein